MSAASQRHHESLYPPIEPYRDFRLQVDALHELYVEECGSADGLPVIVLHGGPGAGISPPHRRFFDPGRYRVILFDQRGAGRSTPAGETRCNTTADLVSDIERIRQHLCIQQWILFGGSWGSALALAYAQEYSERVLALVLRGLFLGSAQEVHWLNESGGGASFIFPERWRAYESHIPAAERGSMVEAYWRRLNHEDAAVRDAAGLAWRGWADGCTTLHHDPYARVTLVPETARVQARIELHYLRHACFLQPGQLLSGLERLRDIPAWLIQGRYDMVCPMKFAHEFSMAWPELMTQTVTGGHSAFDPAISAALAKVTDALIEHLPPNGPSSAG